jgi:hypothetical protein
VITRADAAVRCFVATLDAPMGMSPQPPALAAPLLPADDGASMFPPPLHFASYNDHEYGDAGAAPVAPR